MVAIRNILLVVVAMLSLAACQSMNQKEQRALVGGGVGAGAGYLLGGTQGAVIGGLGGGILGAVTADEEPKVIDNRRTTVINNNYGKKRH